MSIAKKIANNNFEEYAGLTTRSRGSVSRKSTRRTKKKLNRRGMRIEAQLDFSTYEGDLS